MGCKQSVYVSQDVEHKKCLDHLSKEPNLREYQGNGDALKKMGVMYKNQKMWRNCFLDGAYERKVNARFAEDTDDIFMRSMQETYANEKKNYDGSPSGNFIMTEAAARAASSEVLETHKGLTGGAKEAYLGTYFAKAWRHFDVNQGGSIEVIKMPQFMRFLCSDQYMSLQPWTIESRPRVLNWTNSA